MRMAAGDYQASESGGCTMSWDIMIFNIRGASPPPLEDLQESDLLPLGPAAKVRGDITAALPGVDWTHPTWGLYGTDEFSIEFNVGKDDPIQSMMLHVRGGGDAFAAIMAVIQPHGWSALDCSTSKFLDPKNP